MHPVTIFTINPENPVSLICDMTNAIISDMHVYLITLTILYCISSCMRVNKYPANTIIKYVIPVAHAAPTRPILGINMKLRTAFKIAQNAVIVKIIFEFAL